MNIQTQCCGIAILLVLFFFYIRQKRLPLTSSKNFMLVFFSVLLCVTLDVLSIVAIVHMDHLPSLVVELICKTYLASLVGESLCVLMYIQGDIHHGLKRRLLATRVSIAIALIGIATIYCLPLYYNYVPEQKILYTYGPSVMDTYLFALSYVLAILVTTVIYRAKISPGRRKAVQFWMILWLIAAMVQFFNNNLLIVGFGSCIGIVILYLKLENPENNIDQRTGLFNQHALTQYMAQLSHQDMPFSLFSLSLDASLTGNLQPDTIEEDRLAISNYLAQIPTGVAFKHTENEFVVIFPDRFCTEEWIFKIRDYFSNRAVRDQESSLTPFMIFIPDTGLIDKSDDLLRLIQYIDWNHRRLSEDTLITVDEKIVKEMYREREIEQKILRAMETDRVEVFYQPIFSTAENSFTSAEALVRIREEDGTLLPPGLFIDVAEKNGMILQLGTIVFEKVCRFIREQHIEQYGLHYIEVNLSMVQCADESLAQTYISIMQKYGVPSSMINLEITESASPAAKKILLDNMTCLMDHGISFSLDDFGTGNSNLNYIVDMPVSIVKFDRDMSNAYFENGKAKYVMDAAIHMIHGMRLKIVSEGIETREQFETMQKLGIHYIQGYYFSRPLPEKSFWNFLQNHKRSKDAPRQ